MKNQSKWATALAASLLLVFSACDTTDIATEDVFRESEEIAPATGTIILGRYIVVLKQSSEYAGKTISRVIDHFEEMDGVTLEYRYETVLGGFAGEFSFEALERLRKDPLVDYIEEDKIITLPPFSADGLCDRKPNHPKCTGGDTDPEPDPAQTLPWGIERVNGGLSSAGMVAWVIDTGIDLDHPDLNVDATRSKSFLGGKQADNPDDQNGHGTHVAGTIAAKDNNVGVIGVAAGATVVSVRVLDRRGSGTLSGVIAGVDYVAANAAADDVANMSLGGGVSTTLDAAVLAASLLDGVFFSLAAGNEGDDAINHSPARQNGDFIVTICATDRSDKFASWSNFSQSIVDWCEPGVSIESTWKNGGYKTISGTSMAAPHAAGLLLTGGILEGGSTAGPDGPYKIGVH